MSFWSRRPILQHVHDYAQSRRVGPWSTLGVVLVRALCQVPPKVAIPPVIGGHAAPNLMLALVGPSGLGKGASEHAARDAVRFDGLYAVNEVPEFPIGSGEGLAATFADRGAETITTAIFTAAEVDGLAALMSRQGSTLESVVRQLFTGEAIGFANARKDTRVIVPRLSYRAGVIVGVQPARSAVLLRAADGGTPQRFLWLPVRDPDMPDQRPAAVDPITVKVPAFRFPDAGEPAVEIYLPPAAKDAIDAHQVACHRGDSEVDPLDGHALLLRAKVAIALAVLDKRKDVNVEDWSLSGTIMAVSKATRLMCQKELDSQRQKANKAKASETAEREDLLSDSKLKSCKEAIVRKLRKLPDSGTCARHDLRRAVKADRRAYFDTAISELIDEGEIKAVSLNNGDLYQRAGTGYTCTTGTRQKTTGQGPCTDGTRVPPHENHDQGKQDQTGDTHQTDPIGAERLNGTHDATHSKRRSA
jgi:hypothetical protein